MKICVPLRANDISELIAKIELAQNHPKTDIIEIWLDCESINFEKIFHIAKKPLIGVCKSQKEMGNFRGSNSQRLALLAKFIEFGGAYVDSGEFDFFNGYKSLYDFKIIGSFHDFQKTPNLEELFEIIDHRVSKVDIIKIATKINSQDDLKILEKCIDKIVKHKKEAIVLGMGALGKETRLGKGIFSKNYLTFAALNENEKTAEGQITLDQF